MMLDYVYCATNSASTTGHKARAGARRALFRVHSRSRSTFGMSPRRGLRADSHDPELAATACVSLDRRTRPLQVRASLLPSFQPCLFLYARLIKHPTFPRSEDIFEARAVRWSFSGTGHASIIELKTVVNYFIQPFRSIHLIMSGNYELLALENPLLDIQGGYVTMRTPQWLRSNMSPEMRNCSRSTTSRPMMPFSQRRSISASTRSC